MRVAKTLEASNGKEVGENGHDGEIYSGRPSTVLPETNVEGNGFSPGRTSMPHRLDTVDNRTVAADLILQCHSTNHNDGATPRETKSEWSWMVSSSGVRRKEPPRLRFPFLNFIPTSKQIRDVPIAALPHKSHDDFNFHRIYAKHPSSSGRLSIQGLVNSAPRTDLLTPILSPLLETTFRRQSSPSSRTRSLPTPAAGRLNVDMATALVARDFCDPITLEVGGTLSVSGSDPVAVTETTVYTPACTTALAEPIVIAATSLNYDSDDLTYSDFRDPFYASTFPQCYALAATTVVAWMLVIVLVITPRSFLDGGVQVLGRRAGFTSSPSSASSIGGRPWLQKVAALTVAISLTIASAETFKEAELQYSWGVENAKTIQREVLGGTLLKIIRLISSTFLWVAQAQTLIRLFPRQREKVIITWCAAALISLDLIFDSLNSFLYSSVGNTSPNNFTQAIPALCYLFQLALGLLYAAWVIYYSIGKKRYAFYHNQMPNMPLVAFLSLIAIHVPVVFFILDISKPDFAGWGDYVRWVGAAAASVLVWEWVERIEALEREDKKDGVLGREILDGDDMLDDSSSRRKKEAYLDENGPGGLDGSNFVTRKLRKFWAAMPTPLAGRRGKAQSDAEGNSQFQEGQQLEDLSSTTAAGNDSRENGEFEPPLWPSRPAAARTPGGRTDTSSPSAGFDPYQSYGRVHSQPRAPSELTPDPLSRTNSRLSPPGQPISPTSDRHSPSSPPLPTGGAARQQALNRSPQIDLHEQSPPYQPQHIDALPDPSMEPADPPNEVAPHLQPGTQASGGIGRKTSKWNIKSRLEDYAATKVDQWKSKINNEPSTRHLPTVIIPPPPGPAIESPEIQEELASLHRSLSGPDTGWLQGRRSSLRNIDNPIIPGPMSAGFYPAAGPSSTAPSIDRQGERASTAPPGGQVPSYQQSSQQPQLPQPPDFDRVPSAPAEPPPAPAGRSTTPGAVYIEEQRRDMSPPRPPPPP
ncbi:PalH/RIM21-domain-containing protein [Zalerion maritima]|uniref:PalH/RIM21-domain-containing protein n=1 Tax=Zalerion maritima TaxID=339359 RepID=A0AAD5RI39_9PEZI|nr:PalH/RIM21-domain-containing protein [Zalerion maritima]